jgi:hypothetical protein
MASSGLTHGSVIPSCKSLDYLFSGKFVYIMSEKFKIFTLDQLTKDGKELKMKVNSSTETINYLILSLRNEVDKIEPSFQVLEGICYDLITRLPLPIHLYENSFVLRARPNEPHLFTNQSQINYNSERPDLIKLQRFNLDEEQVFYCAAPIVGGNSNGAMTTIIESFKEIFDKESTWQHKALTIGRWMVHKPMKLIALAFYDTALKNSIHMQNIIPYFQLFLDSVFDIEDQKKCRLFYGYFSECAGKVNDTRNNYLLTTAFYHAIKKYYGEDVGILYSSSVTENHGINIVLSKEIVDRQHIKLDTVVVYELFKDPNNPFRISGIPTMESKVDEQGNFDLRSIIYK